MAPTAPPAWTHPLLLAALRAATGTMRLAGLDESIAVCRDLGRAYSGTRANDHRLRRALDNLRWAFPDWDDDRRRHTITESYAHLFGLAAEMAWAPHLFDEDQANDYGWPRRVTLDQSAWPAVELLCQKRPAILITGHCGNWEVLGTTIAHFGFPLHALYRPLNLKPVDRWVRRTRARRGLRLIDKFGAAETLPRLLDNGDPLGFIADQNAGAKGIYVPYFDRLASTYKSIGLLAMQHEAMLICGQARRVVDPETRALRYRMEVQDIIMPDDWADQHDPLFYITARYRRAIEQFVRRDPEQYLWMHRYWKARPRWETQGKPMPGALREKIAALPWMTEASLTRIEQRARFDAGLQP